MCGIIGFNWEDEALVKKAASVLKHRGPDDEGYYSSKDISLGHKRLSVIDLTKKGRQPMSCLNYTVVSDGEIYNYKELKKELRGYKFKSNSDTEVIIYAYDKWKEKCLDRFNGAFAFCIFDSKRKELFLARDRFGIKPLYYINGNKKFIFGSEIKALISFLKERKIDKTALEQFFSFRFTLGEKTLVWGIKKFLPGSYMLYDLKRKKVRAYKKFYELKKQKIENKSLDYYKKKLFYLMKKSVERRMAADVPVACLISGGIDSSVIAYFSKRYNPDLNTFSIGFDTTNELPFARIIAKHLHTNHYEFKIGKDDVLNYIDKMVYYMDEPVGDPGFLPIFVLSKKIKGHNKVLLSGDGGDEVFCGYDRYKLFYYGKLIKRLIFFDFGNDILKRLKSMRGKKAYEAFFEAIRLFDDEELRKLNIKKFDGSKFWKGEYKQDLTNAQLFDIKTLLPGDFFMKSDKMSSAFGLEQRVPYLDHELVEFAFSIPLRYKLRLWNEKYVLKKAFKDKLPAKIVSRRKRGFDVPIDYWFKSILGDKLKKLLDESNHGLYNKKYVYVLLEKIKKAGKNYKLNFILAQKLWSILMFEIWYKRFMK